jgi:DNA polymerase-3 subunit beta
MIPQLSNAKATPTTTLKGQGVQFFVEKQAIFSTLQSVQPICAKRTALDVTANILMQISPAELVLRATDLEISFQSSFQIESSLTENFQFTVHARRLMELVKDLEGNLCFAWDGSSLSISSNRNPDVGIVLATSPTDNFPTFPERIENLLDMDAHFVRSAINQVDPLIPSANANPALNGLLIKFDAEGVCFVATDGHSLAQLKTSKYVLSESYEWILPKKAVIELKKTLDLAAPERIFLGTCAGQLVFSGGNFNFFTRLIADKFPNYQPILDREDFSTGKIDKSLLCATLRRANSLLAGKFISAKFKFDKGSLEIWLDNKEIGSLKERVPLLGFTGPTISCSFYPPYVLTALVQVPQDTTSFMIKQGISPLFFDVSSNDVESTYLIMPVVNNDADLA